MKKCQYCKRRKARLFNVTLGGGWICFKCIWYKA